MDEKNLGERIKRVRKMAAMSQEEFAKRLNLTVNTINRYEKGHRIPDSNFITQMVRVFRCDAIWLLTGKWESEQTEEEAIRWRLQIEGHTEDEIETYLKHREENSLTVTEDRAIYNNVKGDPELTEIVEILKSDLPEAKKLVLKILKGRKEIKEGLNGLQNINKNFSTEEG